MTQDDLFYRPLRAGLAWLTAETPQRVLVLGTPDASQVAALERLSSDVRQADAADGAERLHSGVYGFLRRGAWEALVVNGWGDEQSPIGARHRFTDEGSRRHLGIAREVLLEGWDEGRPFFGSSGLKIDDIVKIRGLDTIGRVRRVQRTDAGYRVEVYADGEIHTASEESLLKIDGDPRDPDFWVKQPPAPADDIALTLTWTKLRKPLSNTLYSFQASKTVFRAYQFIPALKILNSATGRLLIADEVGLGKTIEAGLVWSELEQRTQLRRTLVVAPSSLTLKWRTEMSRRFDRQLETIKPQRLAEMADDLLAGSDPELHAVISLESLRSASDVLDKLTTIRPRFDLVIVDEAHALRNAGNRSHILGGLLSDWADHLLFLSATPINLRSNDLYNLLSLLDDGMFPDADVFHLQLEPNEHLNAVARKIALGEPGARVVAHLDAIRLLPFGRLVAARPDFVRLAELVATPKALPHDQRAEVKQLVAELNTLSGILSRTRKIDVPDAKAIREPHEIHVEWSPAEKDFYDSVFGYYMARAMSSGTTPGFAMQMPLRQAASCLPALQATLRRRDPSLFRDDVDDVDDDEPLELDDLVDVPVLARPLGPDTKFAALRTRLIHLREQGLNQAMIFSTFRGTITYLVDQLSKDFSVREMHGGVPMGDRQPIIDGFRAGEFDILVVSEVGSEGLDFEFCNVLVNYDLPWNPMRVEQRIGRLDRFGQKNEKIFIFNMHVPGTIETDILARLYQRIGIFENSIGDLEPILRDEFRDITKQLLDPRLTDEQRRRRADEIAIAIETKAKQLKKLEEERATLSTIDQLKVDGMTESGPTDGRYVGASEIRSLIETLVRATGATLTGPDRTGVFHLRGTPELSDRLWRSRKKDKGSKFSVTALQGKLRNGDPIEVTFDAELASGRDVELLSVRHPLVDLALDNLETDHLHLRRYGSVTVPGVPAGRRYVVQVDLVETTGIRPSRELWATAVDVDTREPDDDVGPAILAALAAGQLTDAAGLVSMTSRDVLNLVKDAAWARRQSDEHRRRLDNDALSAARLASRRESFRLKAAKARSTLALVRADDRDQRIIRLAEGRLRNIEDDLRELEATMARQRELSLTMTTVALLDVIGAG
ncbi:DEAD/DEAH box helicase family protein [Cellulomonas humilata]|uniref:DEAD/DEAH box helicase family protein n=1 Tax=Cellulomonas humilata TaxID=144055 RepID=A0A7Y6A2K6_9CELL|nr:helicase-related protein [Cellulomonas humilata]NUU18455.1 DEAD/DEAH box helicase family protein [Cellulomonas humilata]